MAKCAFIGLGNMGYPMAGHLTTEGHDVHVYNRTTSKSQKWVDTYGGTMHETPSSAAQGADFVFTCVGNDRDVEEVLTGTNGAIHAVLWYTQLPSRLFLARRAGARPQGPHPS